MPVSLSDGVNNVASVKTVPPTQRCPRALSRRPLCAVALMAAATTLAGCAKNAPQDTFAPAGDNARRIDNLQTPIFAIAGLVLVIVFGVVVFVVIKFRDRGQAMPEQTHGKPALEIGLTILPALILVGIGIPTVSTIFELAKTSDTECVINVTGQQWWWEYDIPVQDGCGGVTEPIVTANQMVMPADTNVLLRLTSRDVIHSFWIPKLNGKRDTVPGRVHTLRMEADQPGIYAGQCTEFCGLSHANMKMEAVALNAADFETWKTGQYAEATAPEAGTLAATGEATFSANCAYCHQVNGLATVNADGESTPVIANPDEFVVAGSAPNLTHLMSRNTFAGATWNLLTPECRDRVWNASPEEFGALYLQGVTPECLNQVDLREWIRNAPAKKPMYTGDEAKADSDGKVRGMPALGMSETQIDELIAYLLERK
jgi:cytochrome c oxidase subunit 2